ncbi:uncharacterized protein LOC122878163 isoform X2 [Siniperca chuatsi]|uniref:uncharacterized protein LOC122878163 isoform X2 n=1 Tax=Siniperca chuatsi TaxID=119488 RepID=UPI001CE0852D|nr:uncharacterized protein LOC122878163 isoform X2 [Siniperca chuatsi]
MRFSLFAARCPSRAEVTGILSSNITLQFTFNVSITKNSHFAVYTTGQRKIAEYPQGKGGGVFNFHPKNTTVFYHITNLKLNDSGRYWASVFMDSGFLEESNKVELIVREENRSSTVPPMLNITTTPKTTSSSHVITVLVVSPVVLLAAIVPWLIWCLVRTKDKQQQPPQQTSNHTVQATVEAFNNVPAPSLVYSVLDFPKRPLSVLEMNPNDTEYAAVSYLPEKRRV